MFGLNKKRGSININKDINPDEIFLDSENMPGFDTYQFEGRIEKPISSRAVFFIAGLFLILAIVFIGRVWFLQITNGELYAAQSERNSLRHSIIFADRGIIYDVNNTPLAWNNPKQSDRDFSSREYTGRAGFSNLLGYVSYPKKDSSGFYFDENITGVEGIEFIYNDLLSGRNGSEIVETDALNEIISQSTTERPDHGNDLRLTIDADVQEHFRNSIAKIIVDQDFQGGGGVIVDVLTGDILSLVSFPEYDSNVLSLGQDTEKIQEMINHPRNPFLNRIIDGLYAPGSVVKPFMAIGALAENIISPAKQILSTGRIVIPNPYNPDNPSIFTDWKAHGLVNMRNALAVSSNVYFYQVGGGFEDQRGLGIENINKYMRLFGFGEPIESNEFKSPAGTVPNPEWKEKVFDDVWRLGDTYFTAIGQYGFQVTPIQMVTAIAAIANEGTLVEPRLISSPMSSPNIRRQIPITSENFKIVKEGMREAVSSGTGTARGLSYPDFQIAAKTGTAELGESKERVNSWVVGFFPYDNPRFAFTIVLERGHARNLIGGVAVARNFFDWLKFEKPEYIR